MAAFETPWVMSSTPGSCQKEGNEGTTIIDPHAPTRAVFSPSTLSNTFSVNGKHSTILIHRKSPLLSATPPQVTRALVYSHPFLETLNKAVGLLTWTSGDPWESFLLVTAFWATILYGDIAMKLAGPFIILTILIIGIYAQQYAPLTSLLTSESTAKKANDTSTGNAKKVKQQKTLEEIVNTLRIFASRCHILLDPFLTLTNYLLIKTKNPSKSKFSSSLFIRIFFISLIWVILNLRPIEIITPRRFILVFGTIFLTWHSKPCRITRAILWRSALVRRLSSSITGLELSQNLPCDSQVRNTDNILQPAKQQEKQSSNFENKNRELTQAVDIKINSKMPGIRFTFVLYENQRRWVGLGWTTNLFSHERATWTDEHLNPAPTKENFELPDTKEEFTCWRWVEGSKWLVEGACETEEGSQNAGDNSDGGMGWIYYDNKWQFGRRGLDGWSRYTRRRKWYRDAELVEIAPPAKEAPKPGAITASLKYFAGVNSIKPPYSAASISHICHTPTDTISVQSSEWTPDSRTSNVTRSRKSSIWSSFTSKGDTAPLCVSNSHASVKINLPVISSANRIVWRHRSCAPSVPLSKYLDDDLTHARPRDGDWCISDDAKMIID